MIIAMFLFVLPFVIFVSGLAFFIWLYFDVRRIERDAYQEYED